MKYESS